jgi:hypothetical protein
LPFLPNRCNFRYMLQHPDIISNAPPSDEATDKGKPDLPAVLFWEFRYETIDWVKAFSTVIERVLDRGNQRELEEMVRFYGREKVIEVLTKERIYLMDHSIERACAYFKLKREELPCYMRKQSRVRRWL